MKIRSGFVSNSSSSSYIIAYNQKDFIQCPCCKRDYESPLELVLRADNSGINSDNTSDTLDYVNENIDDGYNDEFWKDIRTKVINAAADGKKVVVLDVEHSMDDWLVKELENLLSQGKIDIIDS